jgi:hypothetical protein
MANDRGRALVILMILLLALCLAVGNLFFHLRSFAEAGLPTTVGAILQALRDAYARQPDMVLFLAVAPLVVGLLTALLAGSRQQEGKPAVESTERERGADALPSFASALRLLALLQQEGRLVDFLEEDIDAYDDAQVGAAARTIHSGCRKALHERMRIERIRDDEDGATVKVEAGFDPAELRLTGNVHGEPPFEGTLQHGGWRASQVKLPNPPKGIDPTILAPVEVEIGFGGRGPGAGS